MRNKTHNRNRNTRCQKKRTLRRRRRASWASPHLLSCPWFLPPGHLRPRFLVVTILFYPLSLCCPLVILNKEYSWSSSDGTQRPSRESERQFETKVEDFFRSTIFSVNQPPIHKIQNTNEVRNLVGAIFISGRPRVLVMDVRYLLREIESYFWLAKLSHLLGSNHTNVKI